MKNIFLFSFLFLVSHFSGFGQVDHWETAVFADNQWTYRLGTSEPPADWMQASFDDSSWMVGEGGFGYGDDDDNTIINPTLSLYMRTSFEVVDLAAIEKAVLQADYDDAFVAYLNGVEFARGNFPANDPTPTYDQIPPTDHEAGLYDGILPESFWIADTDLSTLLQEGENVLAIQVHNYLISSSDMSSNFFLTFGINDNSNNYGETPDWFFPPLEYTRLPLVRILTNGQNIVNEPRIVADMYVTDNGTGNLNYFTDPPTGYNGKISIEIRGASSQFFPKNNYGFETQDENGENNNYPLLGMPAENDWILHGPFSDKSLIRNALSFDIGRSMMPYASRTRFCELVINNDYRGIYLMMEKIKRDPERVDISKLNPEDIEGDELTGGYIFQLDRDNEDVEEDGWYSPYGSNPFYAYHHPGYDDLLPVQRIYLRSWMNAFEAAMEASDFASTYEEYLDMESFVDYFLINELTKHIDAFKLSFYMYKRKDSNGGKLHLGPIWDFNLGYSNFDFECQPEPVGWIFPCTSRAFWLDKLLNVSAVQNKIACRWEELRQSTLATTVLMNRIDEMVNEISPSVEENFTRWNILDEYVWPNYFVGETHQEEVDYLKDWLTDRLTWMDQNMLGNPVDCISSDDIIPSTFSFEMLPNPVSTKSNFTFRSSHGSPANLTIYDSYGRITEELEIDANSTYEWVPNNIGPGVYFYSLQSGQQQLSGKLIKL